MVHITVAAALRTCPPPPASPLANLRLTNPPVLAALVQATPKPITPDPNGDKNLGNGVGRQFITGACLSTADCAQNVVQSCCAAIAGGGATGICSGIAVGNANGKAGCGFGDGGNLPGQGGVNVVPDQGGVNVVPDQGGVNVVPVQGSGPVMGAVMTDDPAEPQAVDPDVACLVNLGLPGAQNVGFGRGNQFITGQCFSAADCASQCCVAQTDAISLCKAPLVTAEAGGSCNFECR